MKKSVHLIYRFFNDFIKKYLLLNIIFLLLAASESVLQNIVPQLTKLMVDDVLIHNNSKIFIQIILSMFFLYFFSTCIGYIYSIKCNKISEKILKDIRQKVFQHIMHLDLQYHEKVSVGENVSRIDNDINMLQNLFESAFVDSMINVFDFIFITYMMLRINVFLTGISFVLIIFYIVIGNKLILLMKTKSKKVLEMNSDVVSKMTDFMNKIATVKLFAMEKLVNNTFATLQQKLLNRRIDVAKIQIINIEAATLIFRIAEILVWLIGGWMVLKHHMTLGALTAFMVYQKSYVSPIRTLSHLTGQISCAVASLERIYQILDTKTESLGILEYKGLQNKLQLKNICFQYEGNITETISNISIELYKGETVAFVGENGSGKSSIIKLLTRLYKEQMGSILIDGVDLNLYTLESIRKHITVVPQQINLFSMSLKENLLLEDNLKKCKDSFEEELHINKILEKLPDGYNSLIDERESNLSGGEKQKIGVLRSVLRVSQEDILILDEPTSALDTQQAKIIMSVFRRLNCALKIIITHNYNELANVDRIIVLNQGKVVGDGKHEELLAKCKQYRELFTKKSEGENRNV